VAQAVCAHAGFVPLRGKVLRTPTKTRDFAANPNTVRHALIGQCEARQ
jgi:hypothetical protein